MGTTGLFISALLFLADFALAENVELKIVNIDQGPVKGYKPVGKDFFVFYGIPYATAPTGTNRFKVSFALL